MDMKELESASSGIKELERVTRPPVRPLNGQLHTDPGT